MHYVFLEFCNMKSLLYFFVPFWHTRPYLQTTHAVGILHIVGARSEEHVHDSVVNARAVRLTQQQFNLIDQLSAAKPL